jgi:hypothetical protein
MNVKEIYANHKAHFKRRWLAWSQEFSMVNTDIFLACVSAPSKWHILIYFDKTKDGMFYILNLNKSSILTHSLLITAINTAMSPALCFWLLHLVHIKVIVCYLEQLQITNTLHSFKLFTHNKGEVVPVLN